MPVELNHLDTLRREQGFVCHHRQVVTGEPQGELRTICDSCLIERTSGDFFAACKLFDFLLVQFAVLIALTHRDKPLALESGKGRRRGFCVFLPVTTTNHTDRGNFRVIPKHILNRVKEGTLAVTGRFAVEDKHTLLITHTEHGVPKSALQEVSLILIALCDLINELFPPRTLHITAYRVPEMGLHGEKIVPPWLSERIVLQGICPVETVDEVGVGVEIRSRNAEFACCVLEDSVSHTPVTHLVHE